MKDVAPCRVSKKVDGKERANDYFETVNVIPDFMMFSLMNRIRNTVLYIPSRNKRFKCSASTCFRRSSLNYNALSDGYELKTSLSGCSTNRCA